MALVSVSLEVKAALDNLKAKCGGSEARLLMVLREVTDCIGDVIDAQKSGHSFAEEPRLNG